MTLQIMTITDDHNRAVNIDEALRTTAYDVIAKANVDEGWVGQAHIRQPDIILFVIAQPGDRLLSKLRDFCSEYLIPVVIFADEGDETVIASAIQAGVSSYIVKGLSKERIKPVLAAATTRFREYHLLRTELKQANARLQERKLIEKAKGLIMKARGYNENDAYNSLRKLAMERNKKMVDIAESVINTAELMT